MQILRILSRKRQTRDADSGKKTPAAGGRNLIFNQAILPKQRAIFIAVPKTGSTTVRANFNSRKNYIIRQHHLDIQQIRAGLYIQCLQSSLGRNSTFPTDPSQKKDNAEIEAEAER